MIRSLKKTMHFLERRASWAVRPIYYGLSYGQFNRDFLETGLSKRKLDIHMLKKKSKTETEALLKSSEYFRQFKFKMPNEFIHAAALETQICLTGKTDYSRGFIIYGLLRKHAEEKNWDNIQCFEMGTAIGYSALCMAKALEDVGKGGKIVTVDLLPVNHRIHWNLNRSTQKQTRTEYLATWQELIDKYMVFFQSYSDMIMKQLLIPRIHFAYLDAEHTYAAVKKELEYVSKHQKKGDMMLCDDYSPVAFPGVVEAIDEFYKDNAKQYKLQAIDITGGRRYALLERK